MGIVEDRKRQRALEAGATPTQVSTTTQGEGLGIVERRKLERGLPINKSPKTVNVSFTDGTTKKVSSADFQNFLNAVEDDRKKRGVLAQMGYDMRPYGGLEGYVKYLDYRNEAAKEEKAKNLDVEAANKRIAEIDEEIKKREGAKPTQNTPETKRLFHGGEIRRASGVSAPLIQEAYAGVTESTSAIRDLKDEKRELENDIELAKKYRAKIEATKKAEEQKKFYTSYNIEEGKGEVADLNSKLAEAKKTEAELQRKLNAANRSHDEDKESIRAQLEAEKRKISIIESKLGITEGHVEKAEETQKREWYNTLPQAEDFEKYSKGGFYGNFSPKVSDPTRYGDMTDEEVAIYRYLSNKAHEELKKLDEDTSLTYIEKAEKRRELFDMPDKYLESLADVLEYRKGIRWGEAARGISNPIGRGAALLGYATAQGLTSSIEGAASFLSNSPSEPDALDYAAGYIRDDIDGFAGAAFDVTQSIANMVPSMLLGAVTNPAVGAVAMGLSSAGNAYSSAIMQGYGENEARTYGGLIGASEGVLQYILGGIGALGGKVTKGALAKVVSKINSASLKLALNLGSNMASEGLEEGLQTYLDAAFRKTLFDEEFNLKEVNEEAIYSAMLGAVTSFMLEGPGQTVETLAEHSVTKKTASGGEYTPVSKLPMIKNKGSTAELELTGEAGADNGESGTVGESPQSAEPEDSKATAPITPGFVKTEYSGKIGNKTIRALDAIGQKIGVEISIGAPTGNAKGAHNGTYQNGRITIAQDAENPLEVVLCHEVTHHMQRTAPAEYNAFVEMAVNASEKLSGAEKTELINRYRQAYSEGTGEAFSDTQAIDEITADYASRLVNDISLFNDLANSNRNVAQRFIDSIKEFIAKVKSTFSTDKAKADTASLEKYGTTVEGLESAVTQWEKMLATTEAAVASGNINTADVYAGGEVKYDLKNVAGKKTVWVENNPLTNKQLTNPTDIANYIAQHIGEMYAIIDDGVKVYIGKDLPNEYTMSEYSQFIRQNIPAEWKAKGKVSSELGLLIEAATNRRWEKTKHPHNKDAKYGFYRYDSSFAFPVKDSVGNTTNVRAYNVELLIRNASDGKKYLYDIVEIKEDVSVANSLKQREARGAAYKTAQRGNISTNSIPKTPPKVNKQNSLKTGDMLSPEYGRDTSSVSRSSTPSPRGEDSGDRAREASEKTESPGLDEYFNDLHERAKVTEEKEASEEKEKLEKRYADAEAKVLSKPAAKKKTLPEKVSESVSFVKRKMVNSGDTIRKIAKETKDENLYAAYNRARSAGNVVSDILGNKQTNVRGEKVGESLEEVIAPIKKKGAEYWDKFQTYLLHKHNVARMSIHDAKAEETARAELAKYIKENENLATLTVEEVERMSRWEDDRGLRARKLIELRQNLATAKEANKPIFFDSDEVSMSAEESQARAKELLRENPGFEADEAKVRKYIDNLMQYRVDSGLITKDEADYLKKKYPDYIPTYRATDDNMRWVTGKQNIGTAIGKAKGGNKKILPLDVALSAMTNKVVKNGQKNIFANKLLELYDKNSKKLEGHITDVQEGKRDLDEELDGLGEMLTGNTVGFHADGRYIEITVTPELFEAFDALTNVPKEQPAIAKMWGKVNDIYKKNITTYDPTFAVRNGLKDLQDALLNSTHTRAFIKNLPRAYTEIATKGKMWELYQAAGGLYSSRLEDIQEKGIKKKGGKVKENANSPYDVSKAQTGFLEAVDDELLSFVEKVESKENSLISYTFGTTTKKLNSDIKSLTDIDTTAYRHSIGKNSIEHIIKRHGKNGKADHSMANNEDIARVGYVLNNYDGIELLGRKSTEFRDKNQKPAPMIRLSKKVDGTFYVVEAVPDTKAKKLAVVSAYIEKPSQQTRDVQAPLWNVRNASVDDGSMDSISENEPNVNSRKEKMSEESSVVEILKKVGNIIPYANLMAEQAPRLAEFISVYEKGDQNDPNTLSKALLAAAEVTTNFGESGTWGKVLNKYYIPFLNPAIQGSAKIVRTFTGTKTATQWMKLAVKCTLLGFTAAFLNDIINGDDEDYENLPDRTKDNYFLIGTGDGKFIKFPKGRVTAALGIVTDRLRDLIKREKIDAKDSLSRIGENVLPENPLNNNIFKAWFDADLLNEESRGRTWYGTDIENDSLQSLPAGERYDSSTDYISKYVGKALGVSPKKLNYILQQYTGGVGRMVLPMLTPSEQMGDNATGTILLGAWSAIASNFSTDSKLSNKVSGEFYDAVSEAEQKKNSSKGTLADKVVYKHLNRERNQMSSYNSTIRAAEEDENLTSKERRAAARVATAERTEYQNQILDNLPEYREAVERYLKKYPGADEDKKLEYAYREANREIYGEEYAIRVNGGSDVYKKAEEKVKRGKTTWKKYYEEYFDKTEHRYKKIADRFDISYADFEKIEKAISKNSTKADEIAAIEKLGYKRGVARRIRDMYYED